MSNTQEKRDDTHFAIDFEVDLVTKDPGGLRCRERTVLMSISLEDARVMIHDSVRYFPGQSLDLTIHFPGTEDVKACMRVKATVVRIDPLHTPGIGENSPGECLTVSFDTPLYFERTSESAGIGLENPT
jgi:hypothetical protein